MIMTMAAVSALSIGAPAAAQNLGIGGQVRVQQLQAQLQAGIQNGEISRREAMPLREQLRRLVRLEQMYARGGFSGRERADLQHRTNELRRQIRMASRDGDGRYANDGRHGADDRYRDGRDDRDGRYDRADDRDGRDGRDGRYDRDDNDGRWGDGSRDGRSGLAIGSRIGANAGLVPASYRDRFRDGGGFYYRYADGRIYQVDARTNLIVRVYSQR
jgi:hypothetical protein